VRLLLDTHALLWWLADDARLGTRARQAVAEPANLVFVSAATAWEIAVKRALGRLVAPGDIEGWLEECDFRPLPIHVAEAVASAELPSHHADSFDRLLVAQAQIGRMTIVTSDEEIAKYDVPVLPAEDRGIAEPPE
jgi:PIN domain nuclease of toxin-antitoxin system